MDYNNLDELIKHCDEMEVDARYNMNHCLKIKRRHYEYIAEKHKALSRYLNELKRFRTISKHKLS